MVKTSLRILALGDSYTIGEGVAVSQRWPTQLTVTLRKKGLPIADPLIIAQTGWTTRDLLEAIHEVNPQGPFDLVTLLIGVNNQYQGLDTEAYRGEFRTLLGLAINFAGGSPGRVAILSIPDWSVTPFAQNRDLAQIRCQIEQFNNVNFTESRAMGIQYYFDITPISRQAGTDPSLLTSDDLHPSGKMYTAWVNLLLPQITEILD